MKNPKHLPTFAEEQYLWEQGYTHVIGLDEVGRGCFAGPVVTAAVIFPSQDCHAELRRFGEASPVGNPASPSLQILKPIRQAQGPELTEGQVQDDKVIIDDSKRLTAEQREIAADWIKKNCWSYAIGQVGVPIINKIGIGKATTLAMRQAVSRILYKVFCIKKSSLHMKYQIQNTQPFLLIDAFYVPHVKGLPKKLQKPIIKGDQKSVSIAAASIIAKVYRDRLMDQLSMKYPQYFFAENKGYGTLKHRKAIKTHGLCKLHRTSFSLSKFL